VPKARVLVIDDEPDFVLLLQELLGRAGYETAWAATGEEGVRAVYDDAPDLVMLDVTMPRLDGWQVLERIRSGSEVPVLMLTGRGSELEKVRGLRGGADDYVAKPFGRPELLARVEALLRRWRTRAKPEPAYADGTLEIDFRERRVRAGGGEIPLTPLEFKLLTAFVRHAGEVVTHERLLELVWGGAQGVSSDEVRTYVSYLRRKLATSAPECRPIETVRGFGYRYVAS
jgi:DNA-binding response OmpR family regulator